MVYLSTGIGAEDELPIMMSATVRVAVARP